MRDGRPPRPDLRVAKINRTIGPPTEEVLPTYGQVIREREQAHKTAAKQLTTIRTIYINAEQDERRTKQALEDAVAQMVFHGKKKDDTFDLPRAKV